MQVVWDDDALGDLESIKEFISHDNPNAARRVIERIVAVSELLEASPSLGRPARERAGVRELTISRYPYVLVYEPRDNQVHILGVVHQAQNRA